MWVNDVHSLVLVFVKTWLPPSSSLQMLGEVSLKKMIYKWVAKGGGGGEGGEGGGNEPVSLKNFRKIQALLI